MEIAVDDLTSPQIAALLQEHLDDMHATTPPGSVHALDLAALRRPGITFWSAYDGPALLGCGALKELDASTAEIKSMRTASTAKRRGVASALLGHILAEARGRGYAELFLETGSGPFFAPARALYTKFGFEPCPPFADYTDDPHSSYFRLTLGRASWTSP
jgi:putative acetyltransferase